MTDSFLTPASLDQLEDWDVFHQQAFPRWRTFENKIRKSWVKQETMRWSIISLHHSPQFKYMNFHIFTCIIHLLRVYYKLTKWPAPSWLDSSVGRALHRYRKGRGLESRSGLNFFQALISQLLTAPFNNMRTLTFKAQPTNAFFATVNQVFGDSSQLPITVERAVIKSLSTVQITKQCSAVVGS